MQHPALTYCMPNCNLIIKEKCKYTVQSLINERLQTIINEGQDASKIR